MKSKSRPKWQHLCWWTHHRFQNEIKIKAMEKTMSSLMFFFKSVKFNYDKTNLIFSVSYKKHCLLGAKQKQSNINIISKLTPFVLIGSISLWKCAIEFEINNWGVWIMSIVCVFIFTFQATHSMRFIPSASMKTGFDALTIAKKCNAFFSHV